MRDFIIRLLVRLFFREQHDIKKLSLGEEFSAYLFKEPSKVVEILKYNRTCMTLWHWETDNRRSADMVKGMSLMLNILIHAHETAIKINKNPSDEKKFALWKKYKNEESIQIGNKILKAVSGPGAK